MEDMVQKSKETLPVGKVIRERYLIKSLLGQGSSGAVYLVQDQQIKYTGKNLFALKEINTLTAQEIYQFAFSCITLLKLHHPALAHIIDIPKVEKQERVYLLMEYIEGLNLDTLWKQQSDQRFSWSEVEAIMSPIIDAVDYLHNQQPPIVHRDIKPKNIILSESGKDAILVDFGIVRSENTTIEMEELLSNYKAPEVYGNTSDARADIYSLGATCYTLLTGTLPPPALIRQAQVEGGNVDPLQYANQLVATIPQALAEALQKVMSLEPSNRFSSVKQFWTAMRVSPPKRLAFAIDKKPEEASTTASTPPSSGANNASPEAGEPIREKQGQVANAVPMRTNHISKLLKQRSRIFSSKQVIIPLVAVALLISLLSLSITANFWPTVGHLASSSTVTSKATAPTVSTPAISETPISSTPSASTAPYANITGVYTGTIYNIVPNVSTTIAVNIQQMQGRLYGNVVLGPKMQGGGPFTGTIDTSKHLQLLVTNSAGQVTLFLQGSLQSTTSLSGEYYSCTSSQGSICHRSTTNYGLWNTVLMAHS